MPPRKEVLDSLIDEILEITEAKRFGIDVPDSDVDNSYNTVASRMGIDAQKLTQLLVAGGASDDTLKRRLRAQIAWTNLVRGRYKASLEIRDKDVEAQLQLHKTEEKNDVGYEYIMRPVVFIVPRGSPERRLRSPQTRRRSPARALCELQRRHHLCARSADVAVRDQVSKYLRRPRPATSRHSRTAPRSAT